MGFGDEAIDHMRRMKVQTLWVARQQAGKAEGEMRTNFPWKPRMHIAHRALHAGADISGDEVVMYLAHGVQYGGVLEEGSKPHIIRPRNKKALYWKGAAHPVKAVKHPGTKPYAIVQPTAKKYKTSLRNAVLKAWGVK